MHRRDLLRGSLATAAGVTLGAAAEPVPRRIWGLLLHLSYNMWEDRRAPHRENRSYRPVLQFDEALWRELLDRCVTAGVNTLVLDLGDGIRTRSHPEIAVEGAWTVARLRQELARLRECGIEPLPKLNFSAGHDTWLGPYNRMVATEPYYRVCRDLIAEVLELFDGPRLFHLGMDEETAAHQRDYALAIVRQHELWWHDLNLLCDAVRAGGARPWIWSDYYWTHPEEYLVQMPRDVVQSNWYYGTAFDAEPAARRIQVEAYRAFQAHGFDQIPTGSNHSHAENFGLTVAYARRHVADAHLLGFLQTPWRKTLPAYRDHHLAAISQIAAARGR